MKANISNGYRLPAMTTEELTSFVYGLRKRFELIRNKEIANVVGSLAARYIDSLICLGKDDFVRWSFRKGLESIYFAESRFNNFVPIKTSYENIWEQYWRNKKNKTVEVEIYNFDFKLILFPKKTKTLALVETSQLTYEQIWRNHPEVEWYGCSLEERYDVIDLVERQKEWAEIIDRGIERGLPINVIEGMPDLSELNDKDILEGIPSFDDRVKAAFDSISRMPVQTEEEAKKKRLLLQNIKHLLIPKIQLEHLTLSGRELLSYREQISVLNSTSTYIG